MQSTQTRGKKTVAVGISLATVVVVSTLVMAATSLKSTSQSTPGKPPPKQGAAATPPAPPAPARPTFGPCDARAISLVYPSPGHRATAMSTMLIGQIQGEVSKILINKAPLTLRDNGILVHVQPLKPGRNVIDLTLPDCASGKTLVVYAPTTAAVARGRAPRIIANTLRPQGPIRVLSGESVSLNFQGTPGDTAAVYLLPGQGQKPVRLSAVQTNPGVYQTTFRVPATLRPGQRWRLMAQLYRAKAPLAKAQYSAPLEVLASPLMARVVAPQEATLRTGIEAQRLTPQPTGTMIPITKQLGQYVFTPLGNNLHGVLTAKEVQVVAGGGVMPESTLQTLTAEVKGEETQVRIPLSHRPVVLLNEVDTTPGLITATLVGVSPNVESLQRNPRTPVLKSLTWRRVEDNVTQLSLQTSLKNLWGYHHSFEGNTLVIHLRHAPTLDAARPLAGKRLVIDPGHGGKEKGSTGPTGVPEKNLNLAVALRVKALLEQEGASVTLTRDRDKDVSLTERTQLARQTSPHLFVSIHHNALPDGGDPYKTHGSGVYYYNTFSIPLAQAIQTQLLAQLSFRDNGLFWQSLAVTRPTAYPAVLVEVGFMIHPDEYMQLIQSSTQDKAAQAIVDGIKNFFQDQLGQEPV